MILIMANKNKFGTIKYISLLVKIKSYGNVNNVPQIVSYYIYSGIFKQTVAIHH